MEEKRELKNKVWNNLDEIEAIVKQIWPDDKPMPDKDDDEYELWLNLTAAMVHVGDLRMDFEAVEYWTE